MEQSIGASHLHPTLAAASAANARLVSQLVGPAFGRQVLLLVGRLDVFQSDMGSASSSTILI
jgi:hypothetical protein